MNSKNSRFALIIFLNVLCQFLAKSVPGGSTPSPPGYSTTLESNLRTTYFTNYEPLQRPDIRVQTEVTLNLMTINYLDIKDQTLSISAYFSMEWDDSRLDWSGDSTYSNVPFLFSNEEHMWRPAIIVENSVSDISVLSDEETLMRINNMGRVSWTPAGVFQTHCEADVTYYPLDSQECSIIISTWAYTANEVELVFPSGNALLYSNFEENGEWEIKSFSNRSTTGKRESQSFSRLYYTLTLRRRPLFHILNTMFPVLLMAMLTIFVFKLPPDSGERIALSLTVLLAYAVYLTLISENIPQTSISASILSVYLTMILMISTLSVIFTIFVLDIYFNHDDEEPVPEWAQKLTRSVLAPVACWHVTCCSKRQISPAADDEIKSESTMATDTNNSKTKFPNDINSRTKFANVRGTKLPTKLPNTTKSVTHMNGKIPEEKYVREVSSVSSAGERNYKWKEIALILDRCFMYVFIFLVAIPSIVCLALMVAKYSEYD